MGITGLLPFIKNSCRHANIRDFPKGVTVAIDAYSWLHKGAFSCAEKLVKGEKTDGYVHYCMKQLNMLLDAGVKPIMVFDGCNLESKCVTEKKRRENRERTRQKGKEFLCQGKLKEARECFQRCVDVTPEMAFEVIRACRAKNIDYIVAPYEADAQLAYLNISKMCQIVITEDSDLVLFGCEKILFKMDSCGGGMLYEKENLPKSFGMQAEKMSFEKFRHMCILSGCDYLPSLPGIGLAKAYKFFSLTNNPDLRNVLPKLPSYLKMLKLVVSPEYVDNFIKANNTFLYQLVYCPKKKALVPLHPYPDDISASDMEYAGKYFPDEMAVQIANGDVNVKTLEKFRGFTPKKNIAENSFSKGGSSLLSSERISKTDERKSSFKFKHRSPESVSLSSSVRKRIFQDDHENQDLDVQDKFLFSVYFNKKQKTEENEDESVADDSGFSSEGILETTPKRLEQPDKPKSSKSLDNGVSPLRKSLASKIFSTSLTSSSSPSQRIVKSRFFVNNKPKDKPETHHVEGEKEKEIIHPKAKVVSGLMDSIDDEFGLNEQDLSQLNSSNLSEPSSEYPESSVASTSSCVMTESEDEKLTAVCDDKENEKLFPLSNYKFLKPRLKLSLGSQGSSPNESYESTNCDDNSYLSEKISPTKQNIHSMLPIKNVCSSSPDSPKKPVCSFDCSDVLCFDVTDSPVKDSVEGPKIPFMVSDKSIFKKEDIKVMKSLFSSSEKKLPNLSNQTKPNIHSMLPFRNVRSNSPGSPRKPMGSLECSDVLCFDVTHSPVKNSVESPKIPFMVRDKSIFKEEETKLKSLFSSSEKKLPTGKLSGCRSVGLSRNRSKSNKQLNMQDTLLNFRFTRVPKSMPTSS